MEILEDNATQKALEQIREFCLTGKYNIAAAESVTSGLIQLLLSTCQSAGLFFAGGITTYSCEQKLRQLGISEKECEDSVGVSEKLSETMARQICKKYRCELGLGITGFASVIPEKGVKELYAYGAFCYKDLIIVSERFVPKKNTPLEIQQEYASSLIQLCSKSLKSL